MSKPEIDGAITSRRANRMFRRMYWRQRRRDDRREIVDQLAEMSNPCDDVDEYDDYCRIVDRRYEDRACQLLRMLN
jgi:hypothetical protein